MTRTIYVAYNATKQRGFDSETEANDYATANNMQVKPEIVPDVILLKLPDWTGFKNSVFDNKPLLFKCLPCNAYPLVADMIISAEAGATVYEKNFLLGWQLLQSQLAEKGVPFSQTEIDFINDNLTKFEFSIQLTI